MQESRVSKVQKDINEDAAAIMALDKELEVFDGALSDERMTEIMKQRQYHVNRLMFHGFAMSAAEREDENERLIDLGRKYEEDKAIVAEGRITVRSDHLEAIIIYALEQARSSNIPVLDFGANENALDGEEAIEAMENMLHAVRSTMGDHHQDIYLIDVLDYTSLCDIKALRGY